MVNVKCVKDSFPEYFCSSKKSYFEEHLRITVPIYENDKQEKKKDNSQRLNLLDFFHDFQKFTLQNYSP